MRVCAQPIQTSAASVGRCVAPLTCGPWPAIATRSQRSSLGRVPGTVRFVRLQLGSRYKLCTVPQLGQVIERKTPLRNCSLFYVSIYGIFKVVIHKFDPFAGVGAAADAEDRPARTRS